MGIDAEMCAYFDRPVTLRELRTWSVELLSLMGKKQNEWPFMALDDCREVLTHSYGCGSWSKFNNSQVEEHVVVVVLGTRASGSEKECAQIGTFLESKGGRAYYWRDVEDFDDEENEANVRRFRFGPPQRRELVRQAEEDKAVFEESKGRAFLKAKKK